MPLPSDIGASAAQRVIRQFTEALIFEHLPQRLSIIKRVGDNPLSDVKWQSNGRSFSCQAHIGAFGRVRVEADTIVELTAMGTIPATLEALLDCLEAPEERRRALLTELTRTRDLLQQAEQYQIADHRRDLGFEALDAALDEGHPYHPCFKARIGFSDLDNAKYGPEAGQSFQLVWLAFEPDAARKMLPASDHEFWQAEIGHEGFAELTERARRLGLCLEQLTLIPVHPWQWNALRNGRINGWLINARTHFLGVAGDFYSPSQSIRTLFNVTRPERANLKLSMNFMTTSAKRTLDPHCVHAGPAVSEWLRQVIESDPLLAERYPLRILGEFAGIVADRDGELGEQLGAIWRENIRSVLQPGEQAIPLNCLMMVERDGKSFIDPWIERYGVEAWSAQLIKVAILPVWHLLVSHGLATEAHGQNMLLVHHDGWPVAVVLRDFHDSVEYVPELLKAPELVPDFTALDPAFGCAEPNQYFLMESVELLGELLIDCLFVYSFTEISHLLERLHGFDETRFWAQVRDKIEHYAEEHGLLERQIQLGFHRQALVAESLLARKLCCDGSIQSHLIPNPLASMADNAIHRAA